MTVIATTLIDSNSKVYIAKAIKLALKVDVGDVLEWHVEDQRVVVTKHG